MSHLSIELKLLFFLMYIRIPWLWLVFFYMHVFNTIPLAASQVLVFPSGNANLVILQTGSSIL